MLDQLIGLVAPYDCLGCGTEGKLLCSSCTASLAAIPERCYSCRRASAGSLTCRACRQTSQLARVRIGTVYEGLAKDLIWQLKLAGAQSAAKCMTAVLSKSISLPQNCLIVPVPTATSRIRRRGYDQARLLARALAKRTHRPYLNCLIRLTQTHQHGLQRSQRLAQLTSAFRLSQQEIIKGAHIILVDDVITTGATLEAATAILKKSGARVVEAIIFAQP